ncbi:MAG: F0F1 ATP synthase subunit delta [Alphaproteobacteria bacterium]|nr:F0F1 ATP synthase subunit delta [Alphaproteobacteria bacterium]MCK5518528.1 F0F1 ATP synthase subunit delta [Alphaproteobacteria bacterium]
MARQTKQQDIAKRYALAFFDLAKEQNCLDSVSSDFQKLSLVLSESGDFQKFIRNTTLHRADQMKVLTVLGKRAEFNVLTQKFLGILAMKRRLGILQKIISVVHDEISHHKGEVTAGVTAAYALEPAQMAGIAAALGKVCGMTVKIKLKQDASIVGGLVIKIGSRLIDSSIKGKLERLHRVLKNSST